MAFKITIFWQNGGTNRPFLQGGDVVDPSIFKRKSHIPGTSDFIHKPQHRNAVLRPIDIAVRHYILHTPGGLPDLILKTVYVGRALHCVRFTTHGLNRHGKGPLEDWQINGSSVMAVKAGGSPNI